MSPEDLLMTIAEIAVAIIGFASVVSALDSRRAADGNPMLRLRLRLMIEMAAQALTFSLLPLLLVLERATASYAWQLASGALAIAAPAHLLSIYVRQRRLFGRTLLRATLLFDSTVLLVGSLVEGVLVLNTFGLAFAPRFSAYAARRPVLAVRCVEHVRARHLLRRGSSRSANARVAADLAQPGVPPALPGWPS